MTNTPTNEMRADVRQHIKMLHALAGPLKGHGKLLLAGFGQNPQTGRALPPKVSHFQIGDVDAMCHAIELLAQDQHRNIYVPMAVVRSDLKEGRKGEESDLIAVLGLVADYDDPDAVRWVERSPLRPNYALMTSTGRFQCYYLFDCPASVSDAKAVGIALAKHTACDHGTKDVSHVWRVPGALNWPNKKKAAEGRSLTPQVVTIACAWDGSRTRLEDLRAATISAARGEPSQPDGAGLNPSVRQPMAGLPEEIEELIMAAQFEAGDRSKHCCSIISALISVDWTDDEILERLHSCPAGAHYNGKRKDALLDVKRIRLKIQSGELPVWRSNVNKGAVGRYEPPPWPRALGDAAFYGLAGQIARAIEPYTEADPVAILAQLLVAFGSVVGRRNFHRVEDTRHHANLFAIIVGDTSKARKGTSWGRVRTTLAGADLEDTWFRERILNGLSTGEGLIDVVRDPMGRDELDGETGEVSKKNDDPGVEDKRTLIIESEYARTLKAMNRTDNTLSAILREAWDGNDLALMTRKRPLRATNPHISVIGHVTVEDLTRYLSGTDAANGFGNRNLYFCARRSKKIADHENEEASRAFSEAIQPLQLRLKKAIEWAIDNREHEEEVFAEVSVRFDDEARALWIRAYNEWLSEGRPGLLGAVTNRGEAQVIRLALIYALLDLSSLIRRSHLEAALEIWRYAEASAAFIFGDKLGDAEADEILALLRRAGPKGMKRTDIGLAMFGKHASSDKLSRALGVLAQHRLAAVEVESTGGRSAEVWRAT